MAKFAARGLHSIQHAPLLLQMLCTALGTAIGSNVVNNIPMALLSVSVLKKAHASDPIQFAALIECNIGPNLTVAGSLTTMLVITSARQKGEAMGALYFFKIGIWATPLLLLVAVIALYLCSIL